ncbi:Cuscuta receptor 1-like protein [Drosera capensis]
MKHTWLAKIAVVAVTILCCGDVFMCKGCLEEERAAAMQLKASIDQAGGSDFLPAWDEHKLGDCCEWLRVTCGSNGRVISLFLNNAFNGMPPSPWNLNPSVFLLNASVLLLLKNFSSFTFKRWVWLVGSRTKYAKLVSVMTLRSLKQLHLEHNALDISFSGSSSLPTCLKNLTALSVVDMSSNISFISYLSLLPSLKYLNIDIGRSTPVNVRDIAALKNLEELDLYTQDASDSLGADNGYTSSSNLTILGLKYAFLGRSTMQSLRAFPKLKILRLDHSNLTKSFSQEIHHVQWVEKITLNDAHHVDDDVIQAPEYIVTSRGPLQLPIHSSPKLLALDVSLNSIEGEIPADIGIMFSSLRILNLESNRLEGNVPASISLMRFLLQLDLSNNKITIDLSGNLLTGAIPMDFSAREFQLTSNNTMIGSPTKVHPLGSNQFNGTIPTTLCELSGLSILDLSHNNFHGSIPSCLTQIGLADASTAVHMYSKIFVGYELNFFASWSKKIFLDKSLDKQVYLYRTGDLDQLVDETVKFTAKRTDSYQGLIVEYVSGMDLSSNKLTGEIPPEFGGLSGIYALNLSHNNLSGSIPDTLSKLGKIESLDLSYNHLNGQLSPQLMEMANLALFSVAHNNLSDPIPDSRGQFATFDKSSYKGNPFLCGPPVSISCTPTAPPTQSETATSEKGEEEADGGWIGMSIFDISFGVSFVAMFTMVITVFLINPHWRKTWFHFVLDSILKLRNNAKLRKKLMRDSRT